MSYVGRYTFEEAVARGLYSNFAKWSKIGFTPTMTTAVSDIWSAAGAYVFCTTAGKWEVVSSSAGNEDVGTILFNATCDTGGTTTTMLDSGVDFTATAAAGDLIIIDKSGTTPEWGWLTAVANGSVTFSGGLSSGGSCATARTYQIVDLNAAGKTGAHAVKIEYLTSAYAEKSEIVILNGNTAVDTVNTDLFRVNSFRVIGAGSGCAPVGNLTLRADGGGATYSYITAGYTMARNVIYTVPTGKRLWVISIHVGYAWQDAAKSLNQYCRLWTRANREPATGFLTGCIFYPYTEILSSPGQINVELEMPTRLDAKTDIKVSGIGTIAGSATCALRGYLETV